MCQSSYAMQDLRTLTVTLIWPESKIVDPADPSNDREQSVCSRMSRTSEPPNSSAGATNSDNSSYLTEESKAMFGPRANPNVRPPCVTSAASADVATGVAGFGMQRVAIRPSLSGAPLSLLHPAALHSRDMADLILSRRGPSHADQASLLHAHLASQPRDPVLQIISQNQLAQSALARAAGLDLGTPIHHEARTFGGPSVWSRNLAAGLGRPAIPVDELLQLQSLTGLQIQLTPLTRLPPAVMGAPATTVNPSGFISPGTLNVRANSRASLGSGVPQDLQRQPRLTVDPAVPRCLPVVLSLPEDETKLSAYQILLRGQIEAFTAGPEDVTTHARGRNRPITLRQVGIRCRHCKHLPQAERKKGSVYFPFALVGLYQAAQNMGSSHFHGESCSQVPSDIKEKFVDILACKSTVGAGKQYWAKSAQRLGLVDTEQGIRFVRDVEPWT